MGLGSTHRVGAFRVCERTVSLKHHGSAGVAGWTIKTFRVCERTVSLKPRKGAQLWRIKLAFRVCERTVSLKPGGHGAGAP